MPADGKHQHLLRADGARSRSEELGQQTTSGRFCSHTPDDIGYLQDMFVGVGILRHKQPFADVADMSAAAAAAKLPV
ncbi:hypothetical protein [Burkholderia multivorans]|uniref:hypothetical protein n=1 Tax=Burkholderia multivorans TaxID=87883 RepID=UPI0021572DB9|nr:hypothetical protein [Burkholderia multivorans]